VSVAFRLFADLHSDIQPTDGIPSELVSLPSAALAVRQGWDVFVNLRILEDSTEVVNGSLQQASWE
jgi:hypothetical protein